MTTLRRDTTDFTQRDVDRLKFTAGRSMLVDCVLAGDLPIDIGPRTFGHAGPPLAGGRPSPPLMSAGVAGLLLEGQADTPEQARALLADGEVQWIDNHSQGGVGALCGLVTPRVPVVVVEHSSGRRSYAPLSDGNRLSLRFGMHDRQTLDNMKWCAEVFAPMLSRALTREPVDVALLLAKGLLLGDEAHNRCDGISMELLRILTPVLAEVADNGADLRRAVAAIADNPQFGLPVGMAAAKGLADDLHRHGPHGIVTAACGNGNTFGVRVSGSETEWLCGTAQVQTFTALGPYTGEDMNPLLGDSPVMEVVGLGAQAITAAPALIRRFGLTSHQVNALVESACATAVSRSDLLLNPQDGYRGIPLGIAVDRVVAEGSGVSFTMGYLSNRGDGGRVGMGIATAPSSIFVEATVPSRHEVSE